MPGFDFGYVVLEVRRVLQPKVIGVGVGSPLCVEFCVLGGGCLDLYGTNGLRIIQRSNRNNSDRLSSLMGSCTSRNGRLQRGFRGAVDS